MFKQKLKYRRHVRDENTYHAYCKKNTRKLG